MGRTPSPDGRERKHRDSKRRRHERDARSPSPPAKDADAEVPPKMQDAGGETSMSIEETNKMRIALGLKPLNMEAPKTSAVPKEVQEARAKKAAAEQEAQAKELADKIATARQRRQQQDKLRAVKTLGEADEDEGDMMAWVAKSRTLEEKAKAEARAKAAELERKLAEQEAEEQEEAGPASLAGLKVKGAVEDLMEGESLVMTLEDAPILTERMELHEAEDVLVNVAKREQFAREKARRAAGKPAQPFGEDGKPQSLLNKYDEEGDEQAVEIDASGAVDVEKKRRQEEIRAKLAAGRGVLDTAEVEKQAADEFYTAEEAAAMFKPKKKKKKALRKREVAAELDLDALEAEAAAQGGNDLGSRRERGNRIEQHAAALAEESKAKRAKFDHVLQQANYASLALKPEEESALEEETLDDELYESLARAKKAATAKGTNSEAMLAEVARKRRAEQEALDRQRAHDDADGLALTDAAEFVRQVAVGAGSDDGPGHRPSAAHLDAPPDADHAMPDAAPAELPHKPTTGGWVDAEEAEAMDVAPAGDEQAPTTSGIDPAVRKATSMGLGGVLESLRERGELKGGINDIVWGGRVSDRTKGKLDVLQDVYTGSDDKLARDVEAALTRRDEFGRVLTPKEAYRQLCYGFHGIHPSKNTKDKRLRKIKEEIEKAKQATTDSKARTSTEAMKQVQAATHTPYLVLEGQLKPAQISDPASEYATIEKEGGSSPLLGDRKVKMMLNMGKK